MTAPRPISLSVRALVEHSCRSGDLDRTPGLGPGGAAEGQKAHAAVRRNRGSGYVAELPLRFAICHGEWELELAGRADGVWRDGELRVVEEIKTTAAPPLFLGAKQDPAHRAQGEIYAAMLARAEDLAEVAVDITYVRANTHQSRTFREIKTRQQLDDLFERATALYAGWLTMVADHRTARNESLVALPPPHGAFRLGQRELSRAVFATARDGLRLFAEAPTGSGKTAGALFGALKALGHGHVGQVAFLTAKTSGRAAPEAELARMVEQGASLRALTLSARELTCAGDGTCRAEGCARARGGYDRLPEARRRLFEAGLAPRRVVEEVAQRDAVCPHVLSLELLPWVDVVVCDYSYLFDPRVALSALADPSDRLLVLVDEAHNLVERARTMWSARLDPRDVNTAARELGRGRRTLVRSANELARAIEALRGACLKGAVVAPGDAALARLVRAAQHFSARAQEAWMDADGSGSAPALLEVLSECRCFLRLVENPAPRDVLLGGPTDLCLFCADPAHRLGAILDKADAAAVLLSATLSPLTYYHRCLAGRPGDPSLSLASPFTRSRFAVLAADRVSTRLPDREATAPLVASLIAAAVSEKPGSYLAFFPSYEYLELVAPLLARAAPLVELAVQQRAAAVSDHEAFLHRFAPRVTASFLGLAVLGGTFAEAVDLPGERLSGVAIVGLGLPPPDPRREAIRAAFDTSDGTGFDFAYLFPGLTKVVQAAGRVIRTETDTGFALLIDDRLSDRRLRRLLAPALLPTASVGTAAEVASRLRAWWRKTSAPWSSEANVP